MRWPGATAGTIKKKRNAERKKKKKRGERRNIFINSADWLQSHFIKIPLQLIMINRAIITANEPNCLFWWRCMWAYFAALIIKTTHALKHSNWTKVWYLLNCQKCPTLTSTVVAAFCVFLPIRSTCWHFGLMYFLATSYTQGGQVAENRRVCGLVSASTKENRHTRTQCKC